MKISAKRIRKGVYEYRGFIIENMQPWNDENELFWNVSIIGESPEDSVNTLKAGKEIVDMYHDTRISQLYPNG